MQLVNKTVPEGTASWDCIDCSKLRACIEELESTAELVDEGIAEFKMEIWNLKNDNKALQTRIDAAAERLNEKGWPNLGRESQGLKAARDTLKILKPQPERKVDDGTQ